MSSSVFVETPRSASGVDSSSLDGDTTLLNKADSNLVVVYGKNGINVDRQGLENLIDEKTLTSISVIRITSPTPSMEDEEAEEIRKEAEQQGQEDDESQSSIDEEDEEENSDSEIEEKTLKPTKMPAKTRPEILGLTVEEFYPPNEARELAKEILKYAGVTPLKCNVDYEFQRYIIKNDHCYTPFTSPSQINSNKLAIEDETKHQTTNIRKLPITTTTTVKQYLNKRKQNIDEQQRKTTDKDKEKSSTSDHDDSLADDGKTADEDREQDEEEGDEDLDEEGSDYTAESEESAESDNDRDSDSDFDVNNRHGKKRKNFVARRKKKEKQRARSLIMQKAVNNKRRLHSQDHISYDEEMKSPLTPMKVYKQPQDVRKSESSFNPVKAVAKKHLPEDVEATVSKTCVLPPPHPVDPPPVQPKQLINIQSVQIVKPANKINVNASPVQVRTYQMKPIAPSAPAQPAAAVPASPQNVNQIVINKVIASPKGGFTDLSTLITRSDNTQSNVRVTEINSDKQPAVKGFMPLGIETAAKNQLPAQISIQTHQSSSEIAAENDKQLDLIDSIVKKELDRTFKPSEKSTIKENSIPDLVKMLESTEKAVMEKNKISSSFTTSSVEAIDIANAPLLETADDDIPEDLLQHVVELMEDKSLQEAVEKEVLQQQEKQLQEKQEFEKQQQQQQQQLQQQQQQQQLQLKQQIKPIILPQSQKPSTPLTLPSVRQQPQIMMSTPLKQPKSIIEASISNTTTPNSSRDTTPTPTLNRSTNVTYLRREPIQIVRGNGRVITLPPIEAPTTRAKRRAQAQPTSDTSFNDSESCDVSMHSDTSLFADSHALERNDPVFNLTPQPKEKPVKVTGKKKTAAKNLKSKQVKVQEEGESQEDEDDPNKLWCICRQPHNNRFMICCDVCEDWFHGTCVSITKAMGLEMEQNGVEWTCPKCVKKQESKKQRRITELFENKKTLVQLMPQLDVEKKSLTPVQSKITDVFNKKTVVQLMPKLDEQSKPSRSSLNQSNITLQEVPGENKHIIDLKKIQPLNQSNITLQEVPGENKHIIDLKKLQPGQLYTLTRTSTAKRVQAVKTPEPVQNKTHEIVLKKSPPESGSVVGNITKRVIVLPSTPKPAGRGAAMVKATALQQQQLKFPKVPTAAEKKQFTIAKVQQQQQQPNRNVPTTSAQTTSGGPDLLDQPANSGIQQTKSPGQKQPSVEMLTCIVCKKQARANSIYCSDDCIRKHAQNALNAVKVPEPVTPTAPVKLGPDEKKKKSKGLFEDLLSMADRKPKVERVCVLERRTGKLLTGSNAPTTINLKKWLQDNPTFEVVPPGSVQALELEKSKQKARNNVQSPTNMNTFMPLKADGPIVTSVITLTPPAISSPQPVFPKTVKQQDLNKSITKSSISGVNVPRSTTPKHLTKQQHQLNIKTDKSEKEKDKPLVSPSLPSSSQKVFKKQLSAEKESTISQTPVRESSEPVRVNVRRTLKEQLLTRIKELSDEKKLSVEEVEEFVKATELEMYRLFNKDIGAKYKAKYRSLMFNIKDRKNETLLLKICGRLIEPRQLVRMSPEELASQELAQWRENEAKHQLEMIKKSELDMLSCTKTYVLKTHKGEEVIEGKQADRVDLDISIPVEDVVTVLNNSIVSSTTEVEASSLTPRKDNSFELDYSVLDGNTSSVTPISSLTPVSSVASTNSDKKRAVNKERERDREKHHKSKDRHKEKNRKRSRSRSRERHHKSSSRKDERREKEERSGAKRDDPEPMAKTAKIVTAAAPIKPTVPQTQAVLVKSITPAKLVVKKSIKNPTPPIEKFNLIDQILESTKTVEQAANLQKEKPIPVVTPSPAPLTPAQTTTTAPVIPADSSPEATLKSKPQSPSAPDSDQEPSSTVSISTPPEDPYYKYSSDGEASMWTGSINMIDVASFQVSLQTVSGNTYLLSKDLPDELDIVGRISPDTVWDYIGKIKRSPNKEVVIIRLVPSGESETNAYTILYKYLDKRKRLGVIKTTSSNIKDFYIMPLGVGQQMPSVLQPNENFEFYDDVMRPDMLLGIVIRIMGKRHSNASMRRKKEASVISNRTVTSVLDADGSGTFTPIGSPKPKNTDSNRSMHTAGSSRGMRMPHKSIDDEEIDIDAIIKAPITSKKNSKNQPTASVMTKKDDADEPYSPGGGSSDDEVPISNIPVRDDDLKRKMDEINRQIEAQKMEIAGLLSHDQSSSLANISIPSNLHQILASIQSKPEPPSLPSTSGNAPTMVPPPPMIGSLSHHSAGVSHDEEYVPEIMHPGNTKRDQKPSRLAQLSEAELLSMVPDNIDLESNNISSHANTSGTEPPPEKRPRWSEPPPPGMESEYN